jgi:ferric-dicitrate binding protein FerR (iron transport regulator)
VVFTSPEGAPVPAQRGSTLTAESKIETGKGSALLELQDGSQVLIKAHSNVVLRSPDQGKGFSLELFIGKIIVSVRKRLDESPSFRMGTPSAVITVRGTRFQVEVNKKHKTYIEVYEGVVEVEGLMQGSPHRLIRPGFYTGVDPDRAPDEPRESSPGGEGNGREGGREGQAPGSGRSPDDQPKNQPTQAPPKQGSEGKPD